MHNVFIFDDKHGVRAYVRELKGVLMWQFCLSEQVKTLYSMEHSSFLSANQHVPLPMGDETTQICYHFSVFQAHLLIYLYFSLGTRTKAQV